MRILENSGIKESHSNNGHKQTLLVEEKDNLYKIIVYVESHVFQSFAKVYLLNGNKEWTLLHSVVPKEYGLDDFYKPYSENKFLPVINDLKKTIKKLDKVINKK